MPDYRPDNARTRQECNRALARLLTAPGLWADRDNYLIERVRGGWKTSTRNETGDVEDSEENPEGEESGGPTT